MTEMNWAVQIKIGKRWCTMQQSSSGRLLVYTTKVQARRVLKRIVREAKVLYTDPMEHRVEEVSYEAT